MRVIVGCEESQTVCIAFRERGHEAYSCDLQECSGGHPEWHIQDDILEVLKREKFDLGIFHPPCTYLVSRSASWCNVEKYGQQAIERIFKRHESLGFFLKLYYSNVRNIAIENPVGYLSSAFRKPDQIIEPYYFGESEKKRTCLWLKNLPPLLHISTDTLFDKATHAPKPNPTYVGKNGRRMYFVDSMPATADRQRLRSKTFPGIAKAMAEQWG